MSIQVDPVGEIINGDGMLRICAPLLYASVVCQSDRRYTSLRGKFTNGPGPVLVWAVPDRRYYDTGKFNPDAFSSLENEECPLAVANFDIKDDQTAYTGVWCLLICRSMGIMLERAEGSKGGRIFRRLGVLWVNREFWPLLRKVNEEARVEVSII